MQSPRYLVVKGNINSPIESGPAPEAVPLPATQAPEVRHNRRWSDAAGDHDAVDLAVPWSMNQQWPVLVATLSEQCANTSNRMLNTVDFLAGTGRLRPAEVQALREVLHSLRDTSLRAQQITRLSAGRVRHNSDRLDLTAVMRELLDDREAEFRAKKVDVTCKMHPVDVLLAAPVAVTMINAVIDWALSFSVQVHFVLETPNWPEPARLVARIVNPAPSAQPRQGKHSGRLHGQRANDGLHWMLLRQMAASANLTVRRTGGNGQAELIIEFPKTFHHGDGISSLELFEADPTGARSLLDAWVLVIVEDPSLRSAALGCLRLTGISAKAAADVSDARLAVTGAPPDAIVVSTESMTGNFQAFRDEISAGGLPCPMVELTQTRPSFDISGFDSVEVVKVWHADLRKNLAPAVLFELANAL